MGRGKKPGGKELYVHAAVKVVDHMPQFPLQAAGKGLRTGVLNVVGDALVVAVVVVVVVGDVGQCLRGKGVKVEARGVRGQPEWGGKLSWQGITNSTGRSATECF